MSCRDSVYVAASNVVKNRLVADDLYVYKVNDSSVALSPQSDRKLEPCEIIGLLMLIYKGETSTNMSSITFAHIKSKSFLL